MELEYKVIQSQTPLFSDTAKMHEVLETEAKAGWRLLEKEDNYRIRLQRDIANRANDMNLDIDAYRSTIGVSSMVTYGATALFFITLVSLILYFSIWNAN